MITKRSFLIAFAVLWLSLSICLNQPIPALAAQGWKTIKLTVPPAEQLRPTSCGEAMLAMAYQYAYPSAGLTEQEIIAYAARKGYYTETKAPYTSPANMIKILSHYTLEFSSGNVDDASAGVALLREKLQKGQPVIIDVTVKLDDLYSGAHFVLVTGLSISPDNRFAVSVYYNDPLTGLERSAPFYGEGGLWNAWRKNRDPGGAGWWLSIEAPSDPDLESKSPFH